MDHSPCIQFHFHLPLSLIVASKFSILLFVGSHLHCPHHNCHQPRQALVLLHGICACRQAHARKILSSGTSHFVCSHPLVANQLARAAVKQNFTPGPQDPESPTPLFCPSVSPSMDLCVHASGKMKIF